MDSILSVLDAQKREAQDEVARRRNAVMAARRRRREEAERRKRRQALEEERKLLQSKKKKKLANTGRRKKRMRDKDVEDVELGDGLSSAKPKVSSGSSSSSGGGGGGGSTKKNGMRAPVFKEPMRIQRKSVSYDYSDMFGKEYLKGANFTVTREAVKETRRMEKQREQEKIMVKENWKKTEEERQIREKLERERKKKRKQLLAQGKRGGELKKGLDELGKEKTRSVKGTAVAKQLEQDPQEEQRAIMKARLHQRILKTVGNGVAVEGKAVKESMSVSVRKETGASSISKRPSSVEKRKRPRPKPRQGGYSDTEREDNEDEDSELDDFIVDDEGDDDRGYKGGNGRKRKRERDFRNYRSDEEEDDDDDDFDDDDDSDDDGFETGFAALEAEEERSRKLAAKEDRRETNLERKRKLEKEARRREFEKRKRMRR